MLITLPNAFGDAATNMAIDAALLESMPEGLAAFRHYGWLEPAATFGYAQSFADVQKTIVAEISPIRRLTGGGIVDHRNDWTYALLLNCSLPCSATPATTLYKQIHRAISLSLKAMGIENRLAPCPKVCRSPHPASHIPQPQRPTIARRATVGASQCFTTPAANDVLKLDGQKIAGAAMKRNRLGLLVQGSIDRSTLPESFDFIKFQETLLTRLATALDLSVGKLEDIRPLFDSERIEREKHRFSSEAWTQRR